MSWSIEQADVASLAMRFWQKVDVRPNQCWIWTAGRDDHDYGRISSGPRPARMLKAHRVAWVLHYGTWPTRHLLHSCGTPACVRITHLREGDDADNHRDMMERTSARRCKNGHLRTPANTTIRTNGYRYCLDCKNQGQRRRYKTKELTPAAVQDVFARV